MADEVSADVPAAFEALRVQMAELHAAIGEQLDALPKTTLEARLVMQNPQVIENIVALIRAAHHAMGSAERGMRACSQLTAAANERIGALEAIVARLKKQARKRNAT